MIGLWDTRHHSSVRLSVDEERGVPSLRLSHHGSDLIWMDVQPDGPRLRVLSSQGGASAWLHTGVSGASLDLDAGDNPGAKSNVTLDAKPVVTRLPF